MIKGHIKKARRKQRIIKKLNMAVVITLGVMLVITTIFGVIKNRQDMLASDISNKSRNAEYEPMCLASGVSVTMCDYMIESNKVSIEKEYTEILKEANPEKESNKEKLKSESKRIKKDTKLWAEVTVNIREKADKNSKCVGKKVAGSMIIVDKDMMNGWLRISNNGNKAYVCEEYFTTESPFIMVSSTAYWDEYNRRSASGRQLQNGYSLAGKVEWLGRTCELYTYSEDGPGKYLGIYRFDDTGYGAESGHGSSRILDGRTVGTIENGTCIDIYMNNESECINYGRRNVYIRFID